MHDNQKRCKGFPGRVLGLFTDLSCFLLINLLLAGIRVKILGAEPDIRMFWSENNYFTHTTLSISSLQGQLKFVDVKEAGLRLQLHKKAWLYSNIPPGVQ